MRNTLSCLYTYTALKFIWSYKLLLGVVFILCVIHAGCYVLYNYGAHVRVMDQLPKNIDETSYQHSHTILKENPNAKFSRTLPRDNKQIIFFGRDIELKNLTELIKPTSQTCTISITGSPGFGKSTLAIHAGYKAEDLGYTVVYADIVEAHNVHFVKQEIVSRVNLEEGGTSFNDITEWARSIRNTTVLILDNCDSALHRHMGDFQTLLKTICQHSNLLKVIMTAKQETLLLTGLLVHIQTKELQTEDAVRVLTSISTRINIKFARKLAKRVGNVPLALQVIGTLLKDKARSSEDVFSDLQKDIIEALSPKELPVEDRVKTSMYISYQYLPQKFQVCGCVVSKFPGIFLIDTAQFVLNNLAAKYMATDSFVWKTEDAKECLTHLVRRSLLTFNRADQLYKFHQLVKDFFQHILRQRERKMPQEAFIENHLFKMSFQLYSLQQYQQLLIASTSAPPNFVHQVYMETLKELPNHKRTIPPIYLPMHTYTNLRLKINALTVQYAYAKRVSHSLFNFSLSSTYVILLDLKLFESDFLTKFGSVDYFNVYVTNLVNLCKLETQAYNSSYALQTLHRRDNFATVTKLYYLARKNNSYCIESHRIYAEYYKMLAYMYIRLNEFGSFMECWQKLLYLRVFKSKCEKHVHKCTGIQRGLAAFGTGKYRQAISYLLPHLYSRMIPLHLRARFFVLVCYSYIELNQREIAERMLSDDTIAVTHKSVYTTKSDHDNKQRYLTIDQSISDDLFKFPLGVTDDLYHVRKKTCRAMMIFGSFVEKYATQRERRMLGIYFQDKATSFVRFHTYLILHNLKDIHSRKEIA